MLQDYHKHIFELLKIVNTTLFILTYNKTQKLKVFASNTKLHAPAVLPPVPTGIEDRVGRRTENFLAPTVNRTPESPGP